MKTSNSKSPRFLLIASLFLGFMLQANIGFGQDMIAAYGDKLISEALDSNESEESTLEYDAPEFPANTGYSNLNQYIGANLIYPSSASITGSTGVMKVFFQIEKNGKVGKVNIVKSPGIAFDNAILEVLANMPEWTPAKMNGKAIVSNYELRLNFRLQ